MTSGKNVFQDWSENVYSPKVEQSSLCAINLLWWLSLGWRCNSDDNGMLRGPSSYFGGKSLFLLSW